jgi:hypothetical protein
MNSIICKSIDEFNYINNKYNNKYDEISIKNIRNILKSDGVVLLWIDKKLIRHSYCKSLCCEKCYTTYCKNRNLLNVSYATNIMRDEKLKRILE